MEMFPQATAKGRQVALLRQRSAKQQGKPNSGGISTKRISHSVLDPWLTKPLKRVYPNLAIPSGFPPEGIVVVGHLAAVVGAIALAFATDIWWAGLLGALAVAANHVSDVLDGTHARATGQCRNGGELLDHFVDPLSFSFWTIGMALSCGRLELGLAGVICIYATAVLTNIKAKMTGKFTLSRFGPTEFKTLLIVFGFLLATFTSGLLPVVAPSAFVALVLYVLVAIGIAQLLVNLYRAVHEVNLHGAPPDQTEWMTTQDSAPCNESVE